MAITTTTVIPTEAKSPMGREKAIEMYADLTSRPLGTMRGETFGMPANYVPAPARIYVLNHSRRRPWKRLITAVSTRRGADDVLMHNKKLREVYNADGIYRQVEQGRDMSEYREGIQAVHGSIRIPGGPNGNGGSIQSSFRPIPAANDLETPPLRIEVPEGTWDLYLGNYERMKGYEKAEDRLNGKPPDSKVMQVEKASLARYWQYRHNPVFGYTDDGEFVDCKNPFGFLEFVRETVVAVKEPIDQAYLTALDLVEQ